ncbi:LLM class flavin-dependent oxidoreductase [Nonomuraea sp. PA05]|uniref:LLM class flavin-dependent oxidoreductase n=1 Tax=Nonomuraea sp. PA05 TaxID=2604466 RepID=UPI001CA34E8E|nr:LLM class flavin-dependent oxidoreductase [Nonomuraea sp. PA05]
MDHGHALRFGVLLGAGGDVVERARLSEELGYDVVSFRDEGAELDVWTLLSWVAARTSRIRLLAGPVAELGNPAVLARAAASLDLLSGGRVELALDGSGGGTSGAPGEAIGVGPRGEAVDVGPRGEAVGVGPRGEAVGVGPRGEAVGVGALGEAIDVIRGIWAANVRAPLHFDGRHHRVSGAERGPAPAHDIPLWLAAGAGPDALRLAAAKADGWLLTAPGVEPAATGALIAEEAVAAGRDPRELRRLAIVTGRFQPTPGITPGGGHEAFLAGPPGRWVADLLPLIDDGAVTTLLLATDDEDTLRRFATEVAPALRAATTTGQHPGHRPARSVFARRHRREGIDYDAIPPALTEQAVEPGDAAFARVRSTYLRGGSPGLVLRPGTPDEVSQAVRYARTQPVKLSIRSGGHGISGRSTSNGGIVIDVSRLNAIEVVDKATRRVRVGPGARWGEVAAALAPHGWALTSGDYGGVGVGGLATAGGIGWFVREHGLTIDHLRAVDLVLADGSQVHADDEENAGLFWAVRGAGANLGIVTAFEFEAHEGGDVGFAQLVVDATDTAGFLRRWGAAMEAAPRDLTSSLIIGQARPGQPLIAQIMAVVHSGDAETIINRLQPIAAAAPLLDHSIQVLPYEAIMQVPHGPHDAQGEPVTRAALADHLTPELAAAAARLVASGRTYFFQVRSAGGAASDVAPDATAYAGRSANFSLVAFGPGRRALDELWDGMLHHFSGQYINFETDLRPERVLEAYPEPTLRRLRALKRRYDPANVFRDNFNITPSDP